MTPLPRPRRSALFVPGSNQRALEKAATLAADVVILDLEDAVAPDRKPAARQQVSQIVSRRGFGRREVAVRVNELGSPWFREDLQAVASAGADAVVVPKVNSAEDVQAIVRMLEQVGAPAVLPVWAMIETPRAVLHAEQIATSSPRLTVLVVGSNDLTKELRACHVPGRQPLLFALSLGLLAARVGGQAILDGVFNVPADMVGLEAECLQSRQLGFDGKTLIHPAQIDVCNRVFSPSDADVEQARRIVEAFAGARARGQGVVSVDGRLVENVHVEEARRILALSQTLSDRQG